MFLSLSGVTDNWQSPILNYNNPNKTSLTNTIKTTTTKKGLNKEKEIAFVTGGMGRGRAGGALACSGLKDDAIMDVELGLIWRSFW